MKKSLMLGLSLLAGLTSTTAQSEVTTHSSPSLSKMQEMNSPQSETQSRVPMVVLAEVGGIGRNFLSLNFDTRFSRSLNGLGGRIGISYSGLSGYHLATIPIGLNCLIGSGGKYFEVGAGITLTYFGDRSEKDSKLNRSIYRAIYGNSGVTGSLTIGYRKQPVKGGVTLSYGFTPIFGKDSDGKFYFMPYYPYFSIGYAF